MRGRALVLSILSSAAVIAAGWQIGTQVELGTSAATGLAGAGTASSHTYTGAVAQTRFGNVQVAITVENGSVTDVAALHLTDRDQRSVSISNRAAPILRQEALDAQSANVQSVSGATYTSDGYLSSLQSALDQAGI